MWKRKKNGTEELLKEVGTYLVEKHAEDLTLHCIQSIESLKSTCRLEEEENKVFKTENFETIFNTLEETKNSYIKDIATIKKSLHEKNTSKGITQTFRELKNIQNKGSSEIEKYRKIIEAEENEYKRALKNFKNGFFCSDICLIFGVCQVLCVSSFSH